MAAATKFDRAINGLIKPSKLYALQEAVELLAKLPKRKFRESVDVAFNLGVDPRKSDQVVRGSVVLPHGTGRTVRVAVFAPAAAADEALKAGADLVGMEDLAEQIKAGKMDFDMVIAMPASMRVVGQLGQILGPRGMMPNPKDGTVTMDVAGAVKNAKMGQVRYRTDKAGVIHCPIGKNDFTYAQLAENLAAIYAALKKAKPTSAKGVYFKKLTLSTTMGPGIPLDVSSLD